MNKSLLILVLALLFVQLEAESRPYDEAANKAALESKIRIYSDDLRRLRETANNIKRTISNNRANSTLGISTLQQGIAMERDILFNIQSYLTLPFGVSKCDCYSFSDSEKKLLNKDIRNINESLNSLGRVVSAIPQCEQTHQIKSEVRRQLQFVKLLDEALNAQCCGTYKYKSKGPESASGLADLSRSAFQTNMKASNWIYGGLTPSELRLRYFSRSASRNITNCPLATPFFDGKNCINCEGEFPFWDMAKERCAQCAKYYTFSEKNRDCLQSTFYESKEVEVTVPPISQSEVTQIVQPIVGKQIIEKIVTKKSKKATSSSWSSSSSGESASANVHHNKADEALDSLF